MIRRGTNIGRRGSKKYYEKSIQRVKNYASFIIAVVIFISVILSIALGTVLNQKNSALAAPTGLMGQGGITRVTLTWDASTSANNDNFQGYRIYRGTASGEEHLYKTLGNVTSYVDSTIPGAGTYYYYVVAIDNTHGESAHSNEVSAIPIFPPGAPQNLAAQLISGGISLSWLQPTSNGGGSITGFKIYKGLSPGSETYFSTTGNVTSFSDSSVAIGVNYYYYVTSINAAGESPHSTEVNLTYYNPPGAPRNLTATPQINGISLEWLVPSSDGGSPITGYNVFRGAAGSETLLQAIGNVTSFNDPVLSPPLSPFFYYVTASNQRGAGNWSNEVNATPITCPSPPLTLTVTQISRAIIRLIWQVPQVNGQSPVLNYTIYRGTSHGAGVPLVTIGNTTTYMDSPGLVHWNIYFYTITAINAIGESEFSNEQSVLFKDVPSEPQNLKITNGSNVIRLKWDPPAASGSNLITSYSIYRSNASGEEILLDTVGGSVLEYVDYGVVEGQTYFYQITANNSMGESARSIEICGAVTGEFWHNWVFVTILICAVIGVCTIAIIVVLKKHHSTHVEHVHGDFVSGNKIQFKED